MMMMMMMCDMIVLCRMFRRVGLSFDAVGGFDKLDDKRNRAVVKE